MEKKELVKKIKSQNEPMNPVGIYLPLSEIFPETNNNFETFQKLFQKLSLSDALFWCARLNLIISNPANTDHRAKQQYGLDVFFTKQQIEKVNEFAKQHGGVERISIFFRGQLLELIRWICLFCKNQPDDGETFEKSEVRQTFVKAALMASDIWAGRIYKGRFFLSGNIDESRRRALGSIRHGIAGTDAGMDPLKALGRGKALICEYFVEFYPELNSEFKDKTGLSLEQYYICLAAMSTRYLNSTPEKATADPNQVGIFNVNSFWQRVSHMKDILLKYTALESQTADELKNNLWKGRRVNGEADFDDYNYFSLRKQPIFRADDGRAIIIDPVFYSEKALVGPLFYILDGCLDEKANQIFGAYGNAFEKYVFSILKRMYPTTSGLADRLICNLKGKDRRHQDIQIMDACLNDVTKIVLFEIKSAWIREDMVLDESYEKYLEHIRKKYGISSSIDRTDRPIKGVGQLARAINKLIRKEWIVSALDIKSIKKIYPVLVVHDPLVDAPVYGNFLNAEFEDALSPIEKLPNGDIKKGRLIITPLILMTIDDLENIELAIKDFSLQDFLNDYSIASPDRIISLHNYIATSDYRNKMCHNTNVAQKAIEILDATKKMMYPNSR